MKFTYPFNANVDKCFLKTVIFRFIQKTFLDYILTRSVKTISNLGQSKTTRGQLKTE